MLTESVILVRNLYEIEKAFIFRIQKKHLLSFLVTHEIIYPHFYLQAEVRGVPVALPLQKSKVSLNSKDKAYSTQNPFNTFFLYLAKWILI